MIENPCLAGRLALQLPAISIKHTGNITVETFEYI